MNPKKPFSYFYVEKRENHTQKERGGGMMMRGEKIEDTFIGEGPYISTWLAITIYHVDNIIYRSSAMSR